MARDFAQIEAAAKASADAVAQANTLALPPGYINGFGVTLKKDYTVTVSGGAANVRGKQVKLEDAHLLTLQDWVAPRMDTPQHYYIYLSLEGNIYVDIVKPVFNDFYGYYEQPDYGWRVLGKLFVKSNNIIYAIKDVERSGRTVTVGASDYVGYADYYCDGTADQVLINMAIQYVSSAYGGGTVLLSEGNFNIACDASTGIAISMLSNVVLRGAGNGTNLHIDTDSATNAFGIYASGISNINISFFQIASVNGATSYGIYAANISNVVITAIRSSCALRSHITLSGTGNGAITDCVIDCSSVVGGLTDGIICAVPRALITGNQIRSLRGSMAEGIYVFGDGAIVSDNLIYDLSGSLAAGYNSGIRVTSNYASITGNRIEKVKNSGTATNAGGISVAAVNNNALDHNYCYNNGLDTGIANTNGNNFSDAGTDTQTYSNSWQSPVSGEPSLGTAHKHHAALVAAGSINAGNTVDVNANTLAGIPIGSKAINIRGYCVVSLADGYPTLEDSSSNINIYGVEVYANGKVSVFNGLVIFAPGDYFLRIRANVGNITALNIWTTAYYI